MQGLEQLKAGMFKLKEMGTKSTGATSARFLHPQDPGRGHTHSQRMTHKVALPCLCITNALIPSLVLQKSPCALSLLPSHSCPHLLSPDPHIIVCRVFLLCTSHTNPVPEAFYAAFKGHQKCHLLQAASWDIPSQKCPCLALLAPASLLPALRIFVNTSSSHTRRFNWLCFPHSHTHSGAPCPQ